MTRRVFFPRLAIRFQPRGGRGFTQVELVIVLVIVGVLAVVALPRFVGRGAFDTRGFFDQTVAAIQYARQQAIAQRRQVCVSIAPGGITSTRATAPPPAGVCDGTPLLNPSTGAAYVVPVPNGIALAGLAGTALPLILSFDPLGRPTGAASFRVVGEDNHCLGVEAETGYVRNIPCP